MLISILYILFIILPLSFIYLIGPSWLYYNIFKIRFIKKTKKKESTNSLKGQIILASLLTIFLPGVLLFYDFQSVERNMLIKGPFILTLIILWFMVSDRGQTVWAVFCNNPITNAVKKIISEFLKLIGGFMIGFINIFSGVIGVLIFLAIAAFIIFFLYKFVMFYITA